MKKKVTAVKPYIYSGQLNFKNVPYNAWEEIGYHCVKGFYPRWLHRLMFHVDLGGWMEQFWWYKKIKECNSARLVFVQPVTLYFDTFFAAIGHELIPIIWDCWPCYYDFMETWLKKHNVRVAIFTAKQELVEMKRRCPDIEMMWCPEAVNSSLYKRGKNLTERNIDILEFGRNNSTIFRENEMKEVKYLCTKVGDNFRFNDIELKEIMSDAKITTCFPRSITHPEQAQGVETLTQRYWEAMLSRMVIVGHCPQELISVIGYNPIALSVSSIDGDLFLKIKNALRNINDYQELVNKNFYSALKYGDWKQRIACIKVWLKENEYLI